MSGINSIEGLKNVSIDYRPEAAPDAAKAGMAPHPDIDVAEEREDWMIHTGPQSGDGQAKSIVRQLDTLLLNAAGKSVYADAAAKMKTVGDTLVEKGVITAKEAAALEGLAKEASRKLAALDGLSGRDVAKALSEGEEGLSWSKGAFGGATAAASAVKAAVEAQEKLSGALSDFIGRLAANAGVAAALQEEFTELQFQCDRRATEIYSVAVRMHDLVQKDTVLGEAVDPRAAALLDATFKELMPREAVMMHGTAEALETMKKKFADGMRPLADMLDAFAADGSKTLCDAEAARLAAAVSTMRNAIANVRKNGIEAGGSRTEVDKTILDAMDRILDDAGRRISGMKKEAVEKSRRTFLDETRAYFACAGLPGAANARGPALAELESAADEMLVLLEEFALGRRPMEEFDAAFDKCKAGFPSSAAICDTLKGAGVEERDARLFSKRVDCLGILAAQFKELLRAGARLAGDAADSLASAEDVRKIMLGETRLSVYVEAKVRGFSPGDADPETDPSNIASSKKLGAGSAGTTYLLTTHSGREFVFKPELEGRLGLGILNLGKFGAYRESQSAANLNLATRLAAKAFWCEDLVVKYSIGCHDGQFGFFMERAKGFAASGYVKRKSGGKDGISPYDLKYSVPNPAQKMRIKAQTARKLNRLSWLDAITGQGDRHWNNYFVNIGKRNRVPTVKAIDNDASFGAIRTGVQRYVIPADMTKRFLKELKSVCAKFYGDGWKAEYERVTKKGPGFRPDPETHTITVDLSETDSPELGFAIGTIIGAKVTAPPEEIDREFYETLMEMDRDAAKKKAYLDSIAPKISPESLKAAAMRLDDAIALAKRLAAKDKVFGEDDWMDERKLSAMTETRKSLKVVKSDGTETTLKKNVNGLQDYLETSTPSLYKRDYFHKMFD